MMICLYGTVVQSPAANTPGNDVCPRASTSISPRGEIEVDNRGQTSMAGVFAAGDCTTVPYKQIIIAMGEGAKASLGAFDHLIRTSAPA